MNRIKRLGGIVCVTAMLSMAWQAPGATRATRAARAGEKVAYLGVIVTAVDETVRAQLKLTPGAGLAINEVVAESPAERVGLKQHDILEKVDDQTLFNGDQLASLIRSHHTGDKVTLGIISKGKPQSLEVALGEQELPKSPQPGAGGDIWIHTNGVFKLNPHAIKPHEFRYYGGQPFVWPPNLQFTNFHYAWPHSYPFKGFEFGAPGQFYNVPQVPHAKKSGPFLGVELRPVDASLASQLGLAEKAGVLVGHVVEDSPAEQAHLKEYDVIVKLDDETVTGPSDLSERIQGMKKGQKIRLEVIRQGKTKQLEATLGEQKAAEDARLQPWLRQFRYLPRIHVTPLPKLPGQSVIQFEGKPGQEAENPDAVVGIDSDQGPIAATKHSHAGVSLGVKTPLDAQALKRATIVVNSDDGTITVRENDGNRLVTVKDPDGKVLFEGPVTNDVQRAKLPLTVRQRLDKIGAEVKLPKGQEIQELRVLSPPLPPI
jgi:serine protease Do